MATDSAVSKCSGTQLPGTVRVSSCTFFQLCRCCGGIGFSFLGAALFLFLNVLLSLFSVNLCDWEIYPPATKLEGLQQRVKFHAYCLKSSVYNMQKGVELCLDKNYSLTPCVAKNHVGKVGLPYSLTSAGSLCLTHRGITMAVRNVNVAASESVLSTT